MRVIGMTDRRCEYLFQFADDASRMVYVSAEVARPAGHNTFEMYLGVLPYLQLVPILGVGQLKNGGTTFVSTLRGTLVAVPETIEGLSRWEASDNDPSLDGLADAQLIPLDPEDYIITETIAYAMIEPRDAK